MSNTPPTIGQTPWGEDLNDYLATLEGRIDALAARPEHIYNSYSWQYSNLAPPPTGSQVRFDNAALNLAHTVVFRLLDNDGADRTPLFQQLVAGSQIRINDWNNANNIHRFSVTGPANIGASDVTVPVAWISGSGTIPNAKVNVAFLLTLTL